MNTRNKNILVGIIAAIMLCAFIAIVVFWEINSGEPPKKNEPSTVFDIEIGKFPGDKYTTYFSPYSNNNRYITDDYDPLKNVSDEQPYRLQYANQYINKYTFTFNNK